MKHLIAIALVFGLFASITTNVSAQKTSALEMMSTVFKGNYSQEQIKLKLDKVMRLYGFTISEENYDGAGSTLAYVTDKSDIPEMEILKCMEISYNPKVKATFADMAAICWTTLEGKN